jgi:hypothetical protein
MAATGGAGSVVARSAAAVTANLATYLMGFMTGADCRSGPDARVGTHVPRLPASAPDAVNL